MADIVFKYVEMRNAAGQIRNIAQSYKTAGSTLCTNFKSAITSWEGESKEKMQQFIDQGVTEYTQTTIPQVLEALATLLEANADQMEKADGQIAENIPTTLS